MASMRVQERMECEVGRSLHLDHFVFYTLAGVSVEQQEVVDRLPLARQTLTRTQQQSLILDYLIYTNF